MFETEHKALSAFITYLLQKMYQPVINKVIWVDQSGRIGHRPSDLRRVQQHQCSFVTLTAKQPIY